MDGALFGFACALAGVALGLFLGAALLRAAVALTNRLVGAEKTRAPAGALYDWDDWDDEDELWDARGRRSGTAGAVPEPGIGKGMLVLFAAALINGVLLLVLGFAVAEFMEVRMRRDENRFLLAVVDLPFAFLTLTALLVAALPTTFTRAALVAFLYGVLLIGLVVVVGGVLFAVFGLARF